MNPFESQDEYYDQQFKDVVFEAGALQEKEFEDCVFINCCFTETTFTNCQFNECRFENCDLSLIKVGQSTFRNTTFKDSKVIGVDWTMASWSKFISFSPINFTNCMVDYSTFIGLTLVKIAFKECVVKDVDFSEADLTEADFTKANLSKSRFQQTNLTRANFEDATDYFIDVTANTVAKAKFSLPEAISLLKGLDIQLVG